MLKVFLFFNDETNDGKNNYNYIIFLNKMNGQTSCQKSTATNKKEWRE